MKDFTNRKSGRSLALAASIFAILSGCGMIGKKDIAASYKGASNSVPFDAPEVEFKEVPYGQSVGTISTPSFQTAVSQDLDISGITMAQAPSVRAIATTVGGNLPEVGVAGSLNTNVVFSYSKLYIASCTDKCDFDRANAVLPNRLCAFDTSRGYKDGTNDAAWTKSINDMAALFWGRTSVTPTEMSALLALRDEVAAAAPVALSANGQTNSNTNVIRATFAAVCATMKLAPDAIVQ